MTEILCYVCCTIKGDDNLNIFATKSSHSSTPLYKFIEAFLSLADDQLLNEPELNKDKCLLCHECYEKVDQYDYGVTVAEKAQLELIGLLDNREMIKAQLEADESEETFEEIEVSIAVIEHRFKLSNIPGTNGIRQRRTRNEFGCS